MNILFCGEFPKPNNFGGSPTVNIEILEKLAKNKNFNIKAISPLFRGDRLDKLKNESLPIYFLPTKHFRSKGFGDLLCKYHFTQQVKKFICEKNFIPDVIHIDANPFLLSELSNIATVKVLFLHGSNGKKIRVGEFLMHPYNALCMFLERKHEYKALHTANHIFINSAYSKDLLIKDYALNKNMINKIETVKLGFNTERFQNNDLTKEKAKKLLFNNINMEHDKVDTILLFVGGISHHKGQIELINILSNLVNYRPKTILVLVGKDASGRIECQNLINKNNLSKNVFFLHSISDKELGVVFKAADIYTSASMEGFGINLVEAMAMELPVIAWNKGAVNELFVSERHGYLVSNREEFSRKLLHLIDHPKIRISMGKGAKAYVESVYNWQTLGNRVADVYFQLHSISSK